MSVEANIFGVGECLFGMAMRTDFLNLLLFLDSDLWGRLWV